MTWTQFRWDQPDTHPAHDTLVLVHVPGLEIGRIPHEWRVLQLEEEALDDRDALIWCFPDDELHDILCDDFHDGDIWWQPLPTPPEAAA